MDYYDGSYDYYDAYENWDENQYDESGYGYDGYDEYDQGEEYWYDAEEGGYGNYNEQGGYGQEMSTGTYNEQEGYEQGYDQGYNQEYENNMDDGYGAAANGYGHSQEQGYGETGSQQHAGGYHQYDQESQYWQFHEQEASSQVHGSDGYDITGTHMSAFPDVSQAAMASEYRTMSYAASDQHLSPMRSERHNHSENYQSFLPGAMFNHDKIPDHGPSRALSLNRSQHLTLQPGYPSPNHASSPTGMFRDLFWKSQRRNSNHSASEPNHHNKSPLSKGLRTPSRTGLLTPRSADGGIRHSDRDYRRPDTAVGFLAPLTP